MKMALQQHEQFTSMSQFETQAKPASHVGQAVPPAISYRHRTAMRQHADSRTSACGIHSVDDLFKLS
jgi:hypothetical protein